MKLSGYICASNAVKFDYCLELAARSLLPVVDELILCDNDSEDGTALIMQRLASEYPLKVVLLNYDKPIPVNRQTWWVEWLNWVRDRCSYRMQITLDADEVLDDTPECHAAVLEAAAKGECRWFERLNFWQDGRHLIPDGACCGKWVARLGPTDLWMPSDEPITKDPRIRAMATRHPDLRIFHLGFLRCTTAFYAKSKVVQPAFLGTYDPRLTAGEAEGKTLAEIPFEWQKNLVEYTGTHPAGVEQWITERTTTP